MQLRFKYLTICTLSAMLVACGGDGYYEEENASKVHVNPGDGTNELPGDGADTDSSLNTGSGSTGSGGTGSGNTGSGSIGTGEASSGNAGSGSTGSGEAGSGSTDSGSIGTGETGSGNADGGSIGSGETGSGNAGGGSIGTGETGSGNADGGSIGSGEVGSGHTGSGPIGTGETGSGNTGGGSIGAGETSTGNTGGGSIGAGETSTGNTGGGSTGSGSTGGGSASEPVESGSGHSGGGSTSEPVESGSGHSGGGSTSEPVESGSGASSPVDETPASAVPPFLAKYPEPTKNTISSKILGFFDFDAAGLNRLLRNDLEGDFSAMVQFVQSHTVNPKNNEADKMPRLTMEKDALLLVTPLVAMGNIDKLEVEIYQGSKLIRTVSLKEPSRIAASDQSNGDNRARVVYSKQAWSVALNWDEVRPDMILKIVDAGNGRTGSLNGYDMDFAAPGELVVQNIRLGLLTDPPVSAGHYMLNEPAKAGTDYLQTIPASRLIVSKYDDMKLEKVMISNGTIYDKVSSSTGGYYGGDMRGDTAKSTFSVGINLANWGVTSSSMSSQEQPQVTQTVVVHHARGNYSNGVQPHGLSGGNGMLTLIDSVGNEFSHEIGHHYGLGHYPGSVSVSGKPTNYFWSAHHADSGWGYIAFRNKMRGNLDWGTTSLRDGSDGIPVFQNTYNYGKDAMSGGYSASSISRYTHYTGYSTWLKIQPAFDKFVWDPNSPTGYKKWNSTSRAMEYAQPKVPKSGSVWYNSADGNYLKPKQFGVPIYTILGGYDPVNMVGLVYPAARGNWGNVYELPKVDATTTAANCWLNVQYSGREENIALAPKRMAGNANKFHVNLAQSDAPQGVKLYCKKDGEQAVELSNIEIPVSTTEMAPYVDIGREKGYSALRAVEMPQLENALVTNKDKMVVNLNSNARLMFDSYRLFKSELSADAQSEMVRYTQQQIKLYRLDRWINAYRADLEGGNTEANDAFNDFVTKLELAGDLNLNNVGTIKNGTNCLKTELLASGNLNVFISGKTGCTADDSEQWIFDGMGKIHSKKYINQCLTAQSGAVNLALCSNDNAAQVWKMNSSAQRIEQGNKCFDLEGGFLKDNRARLLNYNCGTGGNQKWTNLTPSNSLILAAASNSNLPLMMQLLVK